MIIHECEFEETPAIEPYKSRLKVWVNALRSGEYKQGFLRMKTSSGEMCVLGVACDVSGLSIWTNLSLPSEVQDFYNLDHRFGFKVCYKRFTTEHLADLNDRYRISFSALADIIEAKYVLRGFCF